MTKEEATNLLYEYYNRLMDDADGNASEEILIELINERFGEADEH